MILSRLSKGRKPATCLMFAGVFCIALFFADVTYGQKAEPRRIKLSDEGNSATVSATLSNGQEMDLVIYLGAGQTINANISSKQGAEHFALRIAGSIFELEADSESGELEFMVPESGDYLITIVKQQVPGVRRARAQLTVTAK